MHLLSAVANCPEVAGLTDHPAVFFGYTYRWTAIRDDIAPMRASDWPGRLTPVQQLLGGAEDLGGDHAWGHDPATTPLYGWPKEPGFLTPANPPLRP